MFWASVVRVDAIMWHSGLLAYRDRLAPNNEHLLGLGYRETRPFLASVNVFPDAPTAWRFNGQTNAANLQYMTDNPRVRETCGSISRRRWGYRTGIVDDGRCHRRHSGVEGAYNALPPSASGTIAPALPVEILHARRQAGFRCDSRGRRRSFHGGGPDGQARPDRRVSKHGLSLRNQASDLRKIRQRPAYNRVVQRIAKPGRPRATA